MFEYCEDRNDSICCKYFGCPNIGSLCKECEYCDSLRSEIQQDMQSDMYHYLYR